MRRKAFEGREKEELMQRWNTGTGKEGVRT